MPQSVILQALVANKGKGKGKEVKMNNIQYLFVVFSIVSLKGLNEQYVVLLLYCFNCSLMRS